METMKTASVSACYSSIMLKVTVMAVAAPFYGKKESALQPHLKDLFFENFTQETRYSLHKA